MNDEKSECDNQKERKKKIKKKNAQEKTKLDRAKKKGSVTLTPIRVMNCGSQYAHTKKSYK